MTELPSLPDKEYLTIGEVSQLMKVPAYVLRYWESEFSAIRPVRLGSGQRRYQRKDVEILVQVKDLLYGRKFTIAGARKYLLDGAPAEDGVRLNMDIAVASDGMVTQSPAPHRETLLELKQELEDILQLLR